MTDLARVATEHRDGDFVVRVGGEIDMSNAQELLAAIETAMPNTARNLLVDLTDVSYVDSAGVALFLRLAQRLRGRRQDMSLVSPPGSPVRAVLELAAVPKLVPLVERPDESSPSSRARPRGPGPTASAPRRRTAR